MINYYTRGPTPDLTLWLSTHFSYLIQTAIKCVLSQKNKVNITYKSGSVCRVMVVGRGADQERSRE